MPPLVTTVSSRRYPHDMAYRGGWWIVARSVEDVEHLGPPGRKKVRRQV